MAEEAKTLLRTAVRTFFPHTKQILIVDALLLHSVLHIHELEVLLSSQPKDIRSFLNPLKAARLVAVYSRTEVKVATTRSVARDYYYIPYHPAIDAIKYRIAKLRRKVEALYQVDESKRKDWRCPRCKAEYDQMDILDKFDPELGFRCDRCGNALVQNVQAAQDKTSHEKIARLNKQLEKYDALIARVDEAKIPENDFMSAWDLKRSVPTEKGRSQRPEYVEVNRSKNMKGQDAVKAENLSINLTSGLERAKEEEAAKEKRKQELAKQNLLPVWHTQSTIGGTVGTGMKTEDGASGVPFVPKQEEDEDTKKIDVTANTMQDEVAAYMLEMERERADAERKAKEEDAEDDDEGEDDEFEDVVGSSAVGTPASSQLDIKPMATNGVKREYDDESGPSSEAVTPAPGFSGRDPKRIKFENGDMDMNLEGAAADLNGAAKVDADSEEDEDFEDAM